MNSENWKRPLLAPPFTSAGQIICIYRSVSSVSSHMQTGRFSSSHDVYRWALWSEIMVWISLKTPTCSEALELGLESQQTWICFSPYHRSTGICDICNIQSISLDFTCKFRSFVCSFLWLSDNCNVLASAPPRAERKCLSAVCSHGIVWMWHRKAAIFKLHSSPQDPNKGEIYFFSGYINVSYRRRVLSRIDAVELEIASAAYLSFNDVCDAGSSWVLSVEIVWFQIFLCLVVNVLDSIHESLAELCVFIMKCNITLAPLLYTVLCIFSSVSPK